MYTEDPKVGKTEDDGSAEHVNAQHRNARGSVPEVKVGGGEVYHGQQEGPVWHKKRRRDLLSSGAHDRPRTEAGSQSS